MTIFDLLFLALVLAALLTIIAALVAAVRGHGPQALRILGTLGIAAVSYVAIVATVGYLSPQRVLRVGDPWCFDDWCLSVVSYSHAPTPPMETYTISLRIFSRARRVSQRARGASIYVIDQQGHRYAPEPDSSAVPLDVMLGPGESVTTQRTFKVPAGARGLGLGTVHGDGPVNFIIADEASLLHKPTYVRLE